MAFSSKRDWPNHWIHSWFIKLTCIVSRNQSELLLFLKRQLKLREVKLLTTKGVEDNECALLETCWCPGRLTWKRWRWSYHRQRQVGKARKDRGAFQKQNKLFQTEKRCSRMFLQLKKCWSSQLFRNVMLLKVLANILC